MNRSSVDKTVALAQQILVRDLARRSKAIDEFQRIVWDDQIESPISAEVEDVFRDLALDLDYYEPDAHTRSEDPSYYGDVRLKQEVTDALDRLRALGIAVPEAPVDTNESFDSVSGDAS